ncbi:MAG TPA: FAD-dependent oxidoreductase [Aquabacterium sp.]|uniref:NAD(P)/FAD-dependent oxidoreductase n=1 Tax=Aquabacterium sp. TaxID=1872578 RepID=UPI002E36CB36|nr:FAD-dependent oxidoreductase [Aquabacterium sp.]HEX5373981.1 FAD-dependent oxidoreductase [Aquabacterium sp.]
MKAHPTSNSVVIYGGGVAGAVLAKALSRTAKVTLVDPLDYFEVPMAAPRNLVRPDFAKQAIVPYARALPGVRHIQGRLVALTPSGGVVDTGRHQVQVQDFKVTVLATGSRYANDLMRGSQGSESDRQAFYARYARRVEAARSILIVGGGPIGVEVAGEIAQAHPDKRITIMEAGARLLRGTTEAAAKHAHELLQARGVEVLTNERLADGGSQPHDAFAPSGVAVTSRGQRIPYDLMIWCTGGRPHTDYMRAHFAHVLNEQGRVMVTPELQVTGLPFLYALGDITDLDENKMAWHIGGQVKTAAWNIRQALSGVGTQATLKQYHPQTGNPSMVVTMGSRAGVAQLKGLGVVKAGWFVSMVKARHMLVPKYRKILGV